MIRRAMDLIGFALGVIAAAWAILITVGMAAPPDSESVAVFALLGFGLAILEGVGRR